MDTNVMIDFLANRQPFAMDAARVFDVALKGKAQIFISALSYNNIYYILRQSIGSKAILILLEELAGITEIIDVTSAVIRESLKSDFKDYEDAIQYNCALTIPQLQFIITRNTKDFKKSELPVLTPSEALAALIAEVK